MTSRLLSLVLAAGLGLGGCAAHAHGSEDSPGTREALGALKMLRTVQFLGPYARYKGLLGKTADHDLRQAFRAAFASVPRSVRANDPWMERLEGFTLPNELLEYGYGREINLYADACRPAACYKATLYLLYNPDRKVAWGATYAASGAHTFGKPSAVEKGVLFDVVARHLCSWDDYFPVPLVVSQQIEQMARGAGGDVVNNLDVKLPTFDTPRATR